MHDSVETWEHRVERLGKHHRACPGLMSNLLLAVPPSDLCFKDGTWLDKGRAGEKRGGDTEVAAAVQPAPVTKA